jgi:hypothetical protein
MPKSINWKVPFRVLLVFGPYSQTLSEEYFHDKEKLKIFLRKFEDLNLQYSIMNPLLHQYFTVNFNCEMVIDILVQRMKKSANADWKKGAVYKFIDYPTEFTTSEFRKMIGGKERYVAKLILEKCILPWDAVLVLLRAGELELDHTVAESQGYWSNSKSFEEYSRKNNHTNRQLVLKSINNLKSATLTTVSVWNDGCGYTHYTPTSCEHIESARLHILTRTHYALHKMMEVGREKLLLYYGKKQVGNELQYVYQGKDDVQFCEEDFNFSDDTRGVTDDDVTDDDSSNSSESLGDDTSLMSDTDYEDEVIDINVNDDKADSDTSVDVGDVRTGSLVTFVDVNSIEIPNHPWQKDSRFTNRSDLYFENYYLIELEEGETFPSLTDEYCSYNLLVDAIFGKSINTNKRVGGNLAMDNLIGHYIHTWCNITGDPLKVLLSQRRLVAMVVYKFQRPTCHNVVPKILMQCKKHDDKVGYLQLRYPDVLKSLHRKFTQRAQTYQKKCSNSK